jgi:hypothetical protein
MTLERKNPLPIGRYWVDVPDADLSKFQQWIAERPSQVHVGSTKRIETDNSGWQMWWPDAEQAVTWYLFTVLSPVPWFGPGYPTIADANIQTADDTVQKPPPQPSMIDQLLGASGQLTAGAKWATWGAIALGGGFVLMKLLTGPMAGTVQRVRHRRRTTA